MSTDLPSLEDRFYVGTIASVQPGNRTGWVRSSRGRDLPFTAAYVKFLGTARFDTLRPGLRIGFDVGRSSRGLCVTTIRVYEAP